MTDLLPPGVRRILAPNPGPMTHTGTNTYLVGERDVAVVDPGPDDPQHLNAILQAAPGRITHILITHAHRDHTALVPALREATGAAVFAFGPPEAGRSETMLRLAREGLALGGEGVDVDFRPDETLAEGERVTTPDWTLDVLHTPGHFAGHLSFRLGDTLFCGDHVMDWSTTLISPPDGDLSAYMASTRRLLNARLKSLLPGHGAAIESPDKRLTELLTHREARDAQIRAALTNEPATVADITERVYTDIAPHLLPAAARNVLAHLIDLTSRGIAAATPELSANARFHLL